MKSFVWGCIVGVSLCLLFKGCTQGHAPPPESPPIVQEVSRPAIAPYSHTEGGTTAQKAAWTAKNCQFGKPRLQAGGNFGPTETVYHEGFVAQVSNRDKIPIWVAEGLNQLQLVGNGDRDRSSFKRDPDMTGPYATTNDYLHSGYDQGHQAPAEDFKQSQGIMDESHFLSNIAPQDPGLNRGTWRSLENAARKQVPATPADPDKSDVFIMTGPMFYDPVNDTDHPTGIVTHKAIGPGHVAVPTHFFKIMLGKDDAGDWQCVAFVFENHKYPSGTDISQQIQPVRFIEDHTAINFMPDLDGPQNAVLHNRLENQPGHVWR